MNRIKINLIFIFLLIGSSLITGASTLCNKPETGKRDLYLFEKYNEGKIFLDLFIPGSEETQSINIYCVSESIEEIVFSIPVVSGDKLYPYNITPEKTHSFLIEFDLRYNFCKVYIDGNWLTSILAKKQFVFINGINSIFSSGNSEVSNLSNLRTEGTLLGFRTPVKIVALGSSSVATRSTITGVFCQRLPEYFMEQNIPVHIFNEGIGGSHSGRQSDNSKFKIKHALDRFEEAVLAKNPDFVIINLGINDSWVDSEDPNGESRIPLPEFRNNILFMVSTLKERGIKVILMTPQAIGKKHASWRYERTEKYIKALRKIAGKEKLPLLDQWKMMNKLAEIPGKEIDDFLLSDSMHTNDHWNQISSEALSEIIIDLIKKAEND